jgi:hypothetical protein
MITWLLHGMATSIAAVLIWEHVPQVAQGDLCSLLTEAEAEAIVGKALAAPERQQNGDCWYPEQAGAGGGGEIMLHVFPDRFTSKEQFHNFLVKEQQAADENMRKAVEQAGGTFTETSVDPVPDVGVPAYYAEPTLFLLQGGKVLAIVASSRPHAVAAAAKALPRFR